MDQSLLELLVCPRCKSALVWRAERHELLCTTDRLAFPIRDGVAVMLEDEARVIGPGEAL